MMDDRDDGRRVVARTADLLTGAADRLVECGIDQEPVVQGAWAAALQLADRHIGMAALIEWLRNTADELEDREAARLAEQARRQH